MNAESGKDLDIRGILVSVCSPSSVDQSRLSKIWFHASCNSCVESKRGGTHQPRCNLGTHGVSFDNGLEKKSRFIYPLSWYLLATLEAPKHWPLHPEAKTSYNWVLRLSLEQSNHSYNFFKYAIVLPYSNSKLVRPKRPICKAAIRPKLALSWLECHSTARFVWCHVVNFLTLLICL